MKFYTRIKRFVGIIFPSNKVEWSIFIVYLFFYGFFATTIAIKYRIVYDDRIPWDAYFSFDNRAIVLTGGGFERHPLANYFFDVIRNMALFLSEGRYNEIFRIVLSLLSAITVSFTMVILYKYLKNLIKLPSKFALGLLVFFGFFSTPLLLSFTPETYTYTMFLLVLYFYYASLKIQNNEQIRFVPLLFIGVSVGGLTITNLIKVYLPFLFEKNVFRNIKRFLVVMIKVVLSVGIFILLYLNRLNFDFQTILNKTESQYEKFSQPKITPLWDMVYSWFFGGNMMFSSFVIRDYHNQNQFFYKALFMDVYSSWVSYCIVGAVFSLVFLAYFRQFKNKLVHIIMISFLVDIIIHIVLKFGLSTSYIYGGHFIFIVPMMLGWLLYSFKNNPKMLSFLGVILSSLALFVILNNGFRLYEFWVFLETYYKS